MLALLAKLELLASLALFGVVIEECLTLEHRQGCQGRQEFHIGCSWHGWHLRYPFVGSTHTQYASVIAPRRWERTPSLALARSRVRDAIPASRAFFSASVAGHSPSSSKSLRNAIA